MKGNFITRNEQKGTDSEKRHCKYLAHIRTMQIQPCANRYYKS